MNDLSNKTALITGAAHRLGRATAVALARSGVNTIIHYRESEIDAIETVRLSEAEGVRSYKIKYDFSMTNGITDFLKQVIQFTGKLDIIINSASVYPSDNLMSMNPDSFESVIKPRTSLLPGTLYGTAPKRTHSLHHACDERISSLFGQ